MANSIGNSAYAKNLKVEQNIESDTAEMDAIQVNSLLNLPMLYRFKVQL